MIVPARLTAVLGLLALLVAAGASARAHAYVVATDPASDANVTSAARVSVSFDEPVTLEGGDALVVRTADGVVAPCAGGARVNPQDVTQVVCDLTRPLPRGTYSVHWRVTSADTHVVHGTFAFGVASTPAGGNVVEHSPYDPGAPLATALRWLVLVGVTAIVGGIGFRRLVLRPPAFADTEPARAVLDRVAERLTSNGIALAFTATAAALLVQTAAAIGTDLVHALPALGAIVGASTWGTWWVVRMLALVLLANVHRRTERGYVRASVAGALVLALTLSASGHAIAAEGALARGFAILSDWGHLIATGLWCGGVFSFALGLRPALAALEPERTAGFGRTVIARFSDVAITSVIVLIVTGTIAGVLHVGSLAALLHTAYGQLVLAKVALLAVLLVLGYGNYRRGLPAATRVDVARSVRVETILLLIVLALSAALTGIDLPHPA
jgi:copper transport protein